MNEFEKRIKYSLDTLDNNVDIDKMRRKPPTLLGQYHVGYSKGFHEADKQYKNIIEEARQDFPKNLWVTKGVPDITPLKDWFEKWFGVE